MDLEVPEDSPQTSDQPSTSGVQETEMYSSRILLPQNHVTFCNKEQEDSNLNNNEILTSEPLYNTANINNNTNTSDIQNYQAKTNYVTKIYFTNNYNFPSNPKKEKVYVFPSEADFIIVNEQDHAQLLEVIKDADEKPLIIGGLGRVAKSIILFITWCSKCLTWKK